MKEVRSVLADTKEFSNVISRYSDRIKGFGTSFKRRELNKGFVNGEDIHNSTAKLMYSTEEVSSEQRRIAKF